jgi:hypothetical protein
MTTPVADADEQVYDAAGRTVRASGPEHADALAGEEVGGERPGVCAIRVDEPARRSAASGTLTYSL